MGLLDATMGAAFIGILLAGIMYGVSCIQTYYYFNRYRSDWWYIKLLVAVVFVCDTIHQALISHTVYTYLISHYAQYAFLDRIVWSLIVEVLFNGFVAVLVQSFYMIRIWRLSGGSVALTGLVFVLIFGEFGCVLAYTSKALPLTTFEQLDRLKPLSMTVNALAAAGDIVIAMTLCLMLHNSRTGFKRSDGIINKLIVFTVNTGLLTSVCAVLSLITIASLPDTFIYICFFFSMGRLYSNSLLATLNARQAIREASTVEDVLPLSLRDIEHAASMQSGRPGDARRTSSVWQAKEMAAAPAPASGISIRIDTTHECMRDGCSSTLADSPTVKTEGLSEI